MIVVHLCGTRKKFVFKKSQDFLGLTITDNGNGRAFVKKVRSSDGLIEQSVMAGDHIAAINSDTMIGLRHFEVAKAIRQLPHNTNFTLILIEPLRSEKYSSSEINGRGSSNKTIDCTSNRADQKHRANDGSLPKEFEASEREKLQVQFTQASSVDRQDNEHDAFYDDLTNCSLPMDRLLSKGGSWGASHTRGKSEDCHDTYRNTIEKINSILESFLGISDNILAIQIYRMANENKDSYEKFYGAIENSELSVFNFDRDIGTHLWVCATGSLVV